MTWRVYYTYDAEQDLQDIRVALDTDKRGYDNSVMTFYRMRKNNLDKLIVKNKLLYKKE